ncbi:winged helix-turn-helix transcriptional regulator [Methanoculleus sp.]|uniref:winged helix-turn-helix transcriptional regulator n=1 Tax=Methanoculleus sp. TaxID=90427 RepID=UPI00345A199C
MGSYPHTAVGRPLQNVNQVNRIRHSLPGLTSRVLIMWLRELGEGGFIRAGIVRECPRVVEWELTEKGNDTIPILMSFLAIDTKWYADEVFEDSRARTLDEIYPSSPGCLEDHTPAL